MEESLRILSTLNYNNYIHYIINNKEDIKDIKSTFNNDIVNNNLLKYIIRIYCIYVYKRI